MHDIPLGQETTYRFDYDASLLAPIPRLQGRQDLNIQPELFKGADIWNAYEISWLNENGLPKVRVACLIIPCQSPCIVESKSLKLYFNGFNQTVFVDDDAVIDVIRADISACVGTEITVQLFSVEQAVEFAIQSPSGFCLDYLPVECSVYDTEPALLQTGDGANNTDRVYSHLLRSLCPVTGQPDWATVSIEYRGCSLDRGSLLQYSVSFRNHPDFHELCVERIFSDLMRRFSPQELTVYARYLRRGGIDISPMRSTHLALIDNQRGLRQ